MNSQSHYPVTYLWLKFNRHEHFNTVDKLRLISNVIEGVELYLYGEGKSDFHFTNHLHGLYDGVLYGDLIHCSQVYPELIQKQVRLLVDMIEAVEVLPG